jgi:hypothetical protein
MCLFKTKVDFVFDSSRILNEPIAKLFCLKQLRMSNF